MTKRIFLFLGMVALTPMLWADPPTSVGRLSYVEGNVSFASSAGSAWETASQNFPLATGNQLSTSPGSRAEIQVGSADVFLASDTGITMEAMDPQAVQVRLDRGRASFHVPYLGPDQSFQVDTMAGSIFLSAPGEYRIDQSGSGSLRITAWNGEASVRGSQTSFTVGIGEEAVIPPSGIQSYQVTDAPDPGFWDQWVSERVAREDRYASTPYVSAQMQGADLDEYGTWTVVAGYGPVWFPTDVSAGWAPYTLGRWVWIAPWGWTWVDDEPWGFAPFHYGRWVVLSGSWCWVPGPAAHPVYAPALVRWVGGSPWRGHPPGQVGIRWVPLGPREVYHPLYHASTAYDRAVNVPVLQPRYVPRPAFAQRAPFVPAPLAPRGPVASRRPWFPGWPFAGSRPAVVGGPGLGPEPAPVGAPWRGARPSQAAVPWRGDRPPQAAVPAPAVGLVHGPAMGLAPGRVRKWPPQQDQGPAPGQDAPYWRLRHSGR
jgi:hypothetical protein